jgi:serine/threonine protein kinase
MGHGGSRPIIGETSSGLSSAQSEDRERSFPPDKNFFGWLPFVRQEGIVDLNGAIQRSGNRLRTASRYHMGRSLSEDYVVDHTRILGRGMTGTVKLCHSQSDPKRQYALKSFCKDHGAGGVSEQQSTFLRTEAEVYLTLDHPNIVRLQDVYEDQDAIHLVMEYCSGGELLQCLRSRAQYSEQEAAQATRQMLLAVAYLHSHNVVHRDLKLENFLYQDDSAQAPLKLIDFGFAKYCEGDKKMRAKCGSINYVSPDVLSGQGYTSQCDCWGLGVILFMLLSGYPPFSGKEVDVIRRVQRGVPEWRKSRWHRVSEQGVDLVRQLLMRNPSKRLTAKQALEHPWIQNNTKSNLSINSRLSASALRSLHKYSEASRLQRAALQLVAQELPDAQLAELRDIFLAIDRQGTGGLNLSDLKTAIRRGEFSPASIRRKRRDPGSPISPDSPLSPVSVGSRKSLHEDSMCEHADSDLPFTVSDVEAYEALGRICGLGCDGQAGTWADSDENADPNSPNGTKSPKSPHTPGLSENKGSSAGSLRAPQIPMVPSLPLANRRHKKLSDVYHSGSASSLNGKVQREKKCASRFSSNQSNCSNFSEVSQEPCTPASKMRRAPSTQIVNLFGQLDVNQDGMVDYTDFVAATMTNKMDMEECEDAIQSAFRRFDVDRSGVITTEDLKNVLGETNVEELDAILREEGLYDGNINYDQFSSIVRGKSKDHPLPSSNKLDALRSTPEEDNFVRSPSIQDPRSPAERLWAEWFTKGEAASQK